jgi:hypothetical protein
MEIDKKSLGMLFDELISTNLKCWFAQETIMHSTDEKEIIKAAKTAQETNARRNALIRAIDSRVGDSNITPEGKTYA